MEAGESKGTVTSLASLFPVEKAQRAAEHVRDSITEREKEMNRLQHFISENTNLIKLVQTLPHQLSHQIMVPFGKAAFFPGRLIHTNEFMVLLGDGYHVERTSKQTAAILQRRGQALESQVESQKAMLLDLQAEASFFNATASEAAEGIVEIREDYVEEHPTEKKSESDLSSSDSAAIANSVNAAAEDEYIRMMSRLAELEKEEEDAGQNVSGGDEDSVHDHYDLKKSEFEELKVQPLEKDKFSDHKDLVYNLGKSNNSEKTLQFPGSKQKNLHTGSKPNLEVSEAEVTDHTSKAGADNRKVSFSLVSEDKVTDCTSKVGADNRKAFTGSIVERSFGVSGSSKSQGDSASSQANVSSKPVSRFKMHKANS